MIDASSITPPKSSSAFVHIVLPFFEGLVFVDSLLQKSLRLVPVVVVPRLVVGFGFPLRD